jgi:stage III sporulation protein AB
MAATWIGFQLARRVAERPRQIRQLRAALALLETEIRYGSCPLDEACEGIGERQRGPVGRLFKVFADRLRAGDGASTAECLEQAVKEVWRETVLGTAEKQILLRLGHALGASDRTDQLQHLALAKTTLDAEEAAARDEQARVEKMYQTMGILAGALIVILLY